MAAPVTVSADESLKRSLAKRHYETGSQYYDTADFEAALAEFQKAHKLFPAPSMLFNIGRCYEALGQLQQAIERYEEYLKKTPDAKGRATLEERIQNLRRRVKARQPGPVPTPAAPTPPPAKTPAPPPEETVAPDGIEAAPVVVKSSSGSSPWRIAGWTAVGVGAASLVTAGILGALALSKTGEYEEAYEQHKPYSDARQTLDSAESLERGSFIALGVGLAAAAAGTLILLLKRDRPEQAVSAGTESMQNRLHVDARGLSVQF